MGFQETNINWDRLPSKHSWEERTIGWWKGGQTTIKAHNKKDIIQSLHQPGGCMVTSVNSARRKIIECGVDFRGLGRWAWTRYKGKSGITFRVISAYRPRTNAGAHTVFSQQRSYFDNINVGRQPKDIMIEELCDEIRKWQDLGDLIMLMTDVNEHVGNDFITNTFQAVGLKEAILDQHLEMHDPQPTYQRGSDPIDGIFISANIEIQSAGYLPFGDAPSDHRAI